MRDMDPKKIEATGRLRTRLIEEFIHPGTHVDDAKAWKNLQDDQQNLEWPRYSGVFRLITIDTISKLLFDVISQAALESIDLWVSFSWRRYSRVLDASTLSSDYCISFMSMGENCSVGQDSCACSSSASHFTFTASRQSR